MSVVHQSVEDAVGERGISDLLVPAGHWQLRGQDHRACLVAIFGDLPEVSALRFRHRSHRPVIDDQNIDAVEPLQKLPQTAVRPCQVQIPEQRRGSRVVNRVAIPAGFLCQRRCDITLAYSRWTEHENVFVVLYPGRVLGQRTDHTLAESSFGSVRSESTRLNSSHLVISYAV